MLNLTNVDSSGYSSGGGGSGAASPTRPKSTKASRNNRKGDSRRSGNSRRNIDTSTPSSPRRGRKAKRKTVIGGRSSRSNTLRGSASPTAGRSSKSPGGLRRSTTVSASKAKRSTAFGFDGPKLNDESVDLNGLLFHEIDYGRYCI